MSRKWQRPFTKRKFASPLQEREGIFRITWHYFSDHMTRIEPLRIQIFNGSFTTLLILIVYLVLKSISRNKRATHEKTIHETNMTKQAGRPWPTPWPTPWPRPWPTRPILSLPGSSELPTPDGYFYNIACWECHRKPSKNIKEETLRI